MSVVVHSSVLSGFDGLGVKVECVLSNNLPTITIVGMGNKAIDESRERVRGAITHSGLVVPRKKVVVNLAPAEMPKSGSALDLAIAVAILAASKQIDTSHLEDTVFVGELSLDGRIRPVSGILGHIRQAKDLGAKQIVIPYDCLDQAGLSNGIKIIPVKSLRTLARFLSGEAKLDIDIKHPSIRCRLSEYTLLEDIRGQETAKRVLAIAVAGRHNLLLSGPPGTGKTLLANAGVGLMPKLSLDEVATLTHLYSLTNSSQKVVSCRPIRAPHHTASHISLIGGGTNPKPGEISLAHCGILFLDELLEFPRHTLETLRQPLENKYVNISRAASVAKYPADFILIGALNPCPCGYLGDNRHQCVCSEQVVYAYQRKLSGPMLDRFDLQVTMQRISYSSKSFDGFTTAQVRNTVESVWAVQQKRNPFGKFNSELQLKELESTVLSSNVIRNRYVEIADKLALSTRAFVRTLRVARTIADLDKCTDVEEKHILEAISYRKATAMVK